MASFRIELNCVSDERASRDERLQALFDVEADAHFLLVAVRQLLRALRHLQMEIPAEFETVRHLRDLREHWNQPGDGAKRYAEAGPDGKPFGIAFGDGRMIVGGVLDLHRLADWLEELAPQLRARREVLMRDK